MARGMIRGAIKVLMLIAGGAFVLSPVTTGWGMVVFLGSLLLFLICLVLWSLLFPDEPHGYWPLKGKNQTGKS